MSKWRYCFILFILLISCHSTKRISTSFKDIPFYVWTRGFHNPSIEEVQAKFSDLKNKGIDGIIYSAGKNPIRYELAGKIAKNLGLKFYALLPALIQEHQAGLKKEAYVVNGLGDSAYDKPAYPRNHFLCPNRPETYNYLVEIYGKLLAIPVVDGIQLDVIRFPDVILAPALWKKYNVVMDREYPQYDYCYCDKCVADFKAISGINIKAVDTPSEVATWKQFRYDLITNLVNRLAEIAHAKNKEITAAVFPGPHSVAKKIVRQEWHKWKIDAFFPMNYNDFYLEDTEWIGEVCQEAVRATNKKKPIYSGLFICPNPGNKANESDPENFGLLPEELAAGIQASIKNGAKGICLFTAGRMTPAHWDVLSELFKEKK
ncbi:MAG: hypothetical protein AB8G86_20885 [Saprospiraceae bacterium]